MNMFYPARLISPITLFSLGLCVGAHAGGAVHASMRAEALIEGRVVTLGDIADLSGAAPDRLKDLAQTQLAIAPQPEGALHLTKREVMHLLRESGTSEITVDGADATFVTLSSVVLDMSAVAAAAKAKLAQELQHNVQSIELTPQEDLHEIRIPRGAVSLAPRSAAHRELHHRMTADVDVLLDGKYYRTVAVAFSVSAVSSVLVAHRDLMKGAIPDCDDVELQERDIAELTSPPQVGNCATLQRRLRRNLSRGEVLLANATEDVPAVSEGQYVTLKIAEGAVVVESRALALSDGEMGQRIPVRPTMAKEPVLATIVAPGRVTLSGN